MAIPRYRAGFEANSFLQSTGIGRTNEVFRADDIIFSQGDPADAVFYLRSGKVKVTVTSESGKDAVLGIMGPGDFVGENCLDGHGYRLKTATAMTDGSALRIEKTVMLRELNTDPKFGRDFIAYLLDRNIRVEEDLADQLFNSSEKRLARTLLLLANFGKEGNAEPLIGNISQETLAEMVGTTRSRVSFFMNKFRRLGFVDYEGGGHSTVRVNSSLLNMVLHDGPGGDS